MHVDAAAVAAAFRLGRARSPLEPLRGGSSAGTWRLETDRGRWLVKTLSSPPDWQRGAMRVSATLERAATAAKVAMPAPVEPHGDTVGYWARLDADEFARVSAWVDVTGPTVVTPELAAWAGATLATIGHLDLPGDPTAEAAYPVHPVADWAAWLDTPAATEPRGPAGDLLSVVTDATDRVHAELATGPRFRLAHRDVSRDNILCTADGPVLVDFDHAGPEVPWWEVTHFVFALAWAGHRAPRPDIVRAALTGYRDAAGPLGPATAAAFTGMLAATLRAVAYNLWLATGQRPAAPERRAAAIGVVRAAPGILATMLNSTDQWSTLLR